MAATWEGVGNLLLVVVVVASAVASWSKRATKRPLMALAAAPETCWEMMPDASDSNGSIFSARPSGEKIRQWWASMRAFNRGSVRIRCAQAELRMLAVVVFEGVASPRVGPETMMRDVSGERSGALVPFGSARRATARDLGLGVVVAAAEACEELGSGVAAPLAAGSAIRPTALGVGVAGG